MRHWLLWASFGVGLLGGGCGDREHTGTRVAQASRPALRLVAFTDLAGYLEPCGCQSRPLGGIDKSAASIASLQADHVPALIVTAGDLLFGDRPEGARSDEQARQQETWKAETLVDILNRIGVVAAAPGARDLHYGADVLGKLKSAAKFAWLPEAPGPDEQPEASATRITSVGGIKVGLLGVSTFMGPEQDLPRERLQRLVQHAQTQVDQLRTQGVRLVIGLLSADQRSGRLLAAGLHGVDFVVQAGLNDETAPAPSRAGQSTLFRAGQQGQGLLVVDIYLDDGTHDAHSAPFADVSEWSRREADTALSSRIAELSQRVQAWEQDKSIAASNLETQRQRLQELRAERERAQGAQAPRGNAFDARYQKLTTDLHGEAPVRAAIEQYAARVNEYNRVAFADLLPPPPQPGAARYLGSSACQTCHFAAYGWWTGHAHGRAYTTLERVNKQFNLSCVGCHVTGYEKPGGSSVVHNQGLIHVGCESCHGPGSKHVTGSKSGADMAITRTPNEATCRSCHTPEHSDLFEYTSYVARLRAPGHGAAPNEAGARKN
jgi:hypothetical protein